MTEPGASENSEGNPVEKTSREPKTQPNHRIETPPPSHADKITYDPTPTKLENVRDKLADEANATPPSQLEPTDQNESKRGYKSEDLTNIVEGQIWQNLEPNYPSPDALLPRELTAEQIQALFDAVADSSMLTDHARDNNKFSFDNKDIPGLGTLRKFGSGGSKAVYELVTTIGKKLIVSMTTADPKEGITIPVDPKLVKKKSSDLRQNDWEYSDLHTYLILPVNEKGAVVQLQEHGGHNNTLDRLGFRDKTIALTLNLKNRALKKATKYINSKSDKFKVAPDMHYQGDLVTDSHYLFNRGPRHFPALIDIPVVEAK